MFAGASQFVGRHTREVIRAARLCTAGCESKLPEVDREHVAIQEAIERRHVMAARAATRMYIVHGARLLILRLKT